MVGGSETGGVTGAVPDAGHTGQIAGDGGVGTRVDRPARTVPVLHEGSGAAIVLARAGPGGTGGPAVRRRHTGDCGEEIAGSAGLGTRRHGPGRSVPTFHQRAGRIAAGVHGRPDGPAVRGVRAGHGGQILPLRPGRPRRGDDGPRRAVPVFDQSSTTGHVGLDAGDEVVLDLMGTREPDGPAVRRPGTGDGIELVERSAGGCPPDLRPPPSVPVHDDAGLWTLGAVERRAHRPAVRRPGAGDREEVGVDIGHRHRRPGHPVPVLGQRDRSTLPGFFLSPDGPAVRIVDAGHAPQEGGLGPGGDDVGSGRPARPVPSLHHGARLRVVPETGSPHGPAVPGAGTGGAQQEIVARRTGVGPGDDVPARIRARRRSRNGSRQGEEAGGRGDQAPHDPPARPRSLHFAHLCLSSQPMTA